MPLVAIAGGRRCALTPPDPAALTSFTVTNTSGGAVGDAEVDVAFNIQITAFDQYGSVYTAFTGTVDITSTGSLSAGGGTTASFTAGVLASHSVTFDAADTGITITATETAGSVDGDSAAFDVTASEWTTFKSRDVDEFPSQTGWFKASNPAVQDRWQNPNGDRLRMVYPEGFPGSGAPYEIGASGVNKAVLAVRMNKFSVSANFYGHSTDQNKIAHFYINGVNRMFTTLRGDTTDPLIFGVGFQQCVVPSASTEWVIDLECVRGQDYTFEIQMGANSTGTADGWIRVLVDGVEYPLFVEDTGLPAAQDAIQWTSIADTWEEVRWSPTWGGSGGTVPAEMYMQCGSDEVDGPGVELLEPAA